MSQQVNNYDFAYSVGVVRALENFLLNQNEVERMMLAKDAKDAFRILNETDYADNKVGIDNPADFQKVLNEGLIDIKKRLDNITPNKEIINILWHFYDFHNIKTIMKAKLSGKKYEEIEHLLMADMGAIPVEALRVFIIEEKDTSFGLSWDKAESFLKEKIRRCEWTYEKGKRNPQIIDLYLDQKMMKLAHKIARDYGNEFLHKYIKILIDLTNIRLMFRMKSQNKSQELYEMATMWDGTIPHTKFINAYKQSLSEFPATMSATPYANIVEKGYKAYTEEDSFLELEKGTENYLTDYIKQAKLKPFGPEPLIAYFLAKKNNALLIRMLLISKLNNIDPEEIRGRLRQLYS
ncbi:hypothetical protein GF340_02005 [Candidatus Peregrinibacteria bacterium]|nr:hypothetical protein [Candidatus Peregrinibacteria bacterium]